MVKKVFADLLPDQQQLLMVTVGAALREMGYEIQVSLSLEHNTSISLSLSPSFFVLLHLGLYVWLSHFRGMLPFLYGRSASYILVDKIKDFLKY